MYLLVQEHHIFHVKLDISRKICRKIPGGSWSAIICMSAIIISICSSDRPICCMCVIIAMIEAEPEQRCQAVDLT